MSSSLLCATFALTTVALQPYEAVEPHMGTLFKIKLYAANQEQAQKAFRAAFDRVAELDRVLSDYDPESELSRVSRVAVGHSTPVSDDLYRVLDHSLKLSEESDGAFDMTIGSLTRLWRTARKNGRLPSAEEIAAARSTSGYRHLHIDEAQHTVEFDRDGIQLDAGGIGKGDAADQALEVLQTCGIRSALVAASGDLAFSDAPPGQPGWKIGIDAVDQANASFAQTLTLRNGAVSTSGASEQHLDANGVRYSHLLNPRTGMALTEDITVTVVASRGIDADPMTKVVSVFGDEAGRAFVNRHKGMCAYTVTKSRPQYSR